MDSFYPEFGSRARLSDDGMYRYELSRRWARGPAATFIMLNPSTADATLDDATIRKCRGFAQRWQMGAIVVVNLFALRATDPNLLKSGIQHEYDVVGPDNDDVIHDAVVRSRVVIAAWGSKGNLINRDIEVCEMLKILGRDPMCLKVTKGGFPQHPLYAPYKCIPVRLQV